MKKLLLVFQFSFLITVAPSQDLQEEFTRFRASQAEGFREEMRRQDSIFAMAIKENWISFQVNKPYEYLPEYPKPQLQPDNVQQLEPIHYQAEPEVRTLRSFKPITYEHLDFYPEEDNLADFDFYGQDCRFNYPSSLIGGLQYQPTKEYVADFWNLISRRPYQKLVNDLASLKDQLNLPGYGFCKILEEFTSNLMVDADKKVMYQWFLLSKSGYNARLGFSDGKPVLIVASETKVFGRPYFQESGITYYVLREGVSEIETYGKVPTNAVMPIDFLFEEAPDLPLLPRHKTFKFIHGEIEYHWDIYYNQNVVDLLEGFPLVDLPSYFNSKGSFLLEKSLKKEIAADLQNKTQAEIVALLLSFTQKAFEYQTDQVQFGREKILFPDQFIHFEKSDCDDRVVFLNYLLSLFTEIETVALLFPQHIALGAKLKLPAYGETVNYAGSRFTFCDPTFYNAPIGAVIPQADREQLKVLGF